MSVNTQYIRKQNTEAELATYMDISYNGNTTCLENIKLSNTSDHSAYDKQERC